MTVADLEKIQSRSKIPFSANDAIAVIRYGEWSCGVILENGKVVSQSREP